MSNNKVWTENAALIVASLGGWQVVFELCLSNPNVNDKIDVDQFHLLINQIATSNNIVPPELTSYRYASHQNETVHSISSPTKDKDIDADFNTLNLGSHPQATSNNSIDLDDIALGLTPSIDTNDRYHESNDYNAGHDHNYDQRRVHSNSTTVAPMSIDHSQTARAQHDKDTHNISNVKSQQEQENVIMVHTKSQFYKAKIVLNSNKQHNLFFKYFSEQTALFMTESILSNKSFQMSFVIFATICFILAMIFWYVLDNLLLWNLLLCLLNICSSVFGILYIFGANIQIINLIIQTFDFWFKVYSTISAIVSFGIMIILTDSHNSRDNGTGEEIMSILASLAAGVAFTAAFLIDAMVLPSLIKKLASVGAAITTLYFGIEGYLYGPSYNWNPFESYGFEHSDINFKSIYTSSMINLTIFLTLNV